MSDGRYPLQSPQGHRVPFHRDDPTYGGHPPQPHSTHSQRSSLAYGNSAHPRPVHPGQAPSFPHGYPMPPRPTTPSTPSFPPPRARATSMSLAHHPAHAHVQHPHLHHHRSPSSQVPVHPSPLSSSTHRAHDMAQLAALQQRSRTPVPSSSSGHYYGHTSDGTVPASPQRPFQCDMCALSFNRQHDLKRHKETHTGERPYPCNGPCGKTFTRKDALKRHQISKNCGTLDDH